ncbi:MAG: glycosyltransferase family 2 protein [Alphaproteobacteria bacterium]|jgi:glycosyltransferase involved in cell wall biosynthesis|nr:glycosyltransferase family 2 protein [Alphaproteobacteria bacterium]MCB1551960.1 glycosyltransferase family 2 protein [Alphaproteobacteria bacterium]MCB9984693.1 glycosyltransferase family 2 protein [Micavibrio sp.]HRK98360.1 glycosyltransferase [Alphaproteobacteria bacterium]
MDQEKVTIGMTCYNSADTIGRAIQSALAQNYSNKEILIVDDGSSDESVGVITQMISRNPEARLIIHKENTGFAGALNTLIQEAQGKYLVIFDDDDVSVDHRVQTQLDRILSYQKEFHTDMVVCHSARLQSYQDGSEFYEPTAGCVEGEAPHGVNMANRILVGHLSKGVVGSCANCSRMAPVSAFKVIQGFDRNLRRCEDTDFNVRFALAGGHFVGIAEPLVIQTMTGGNDKTLDREYAAEKMMIEKHKDYLSSIGWYSFCVAWQDVKYANLSGQFREVFVKILFLLFRHPVQTLCKIGWAIPAKRTRSRLKSFYVMQGSR